MKKILTALLLTFPLFTQAETAMNNTPKAYVIGETEVLDAEKLEPYRQKMVKTLEAYGGKFIVRGTNPIVTEGAESKGRMAIIEFPSLALAKEWYGSVAYSALRPIRQGSTNSRVMIVEGVMPEVK